MSVSKVHTKMVKIGDYIEDYELKNISDLDLPFFGINKDKSFMPTVANTTGLDKSKYKIVEKDVFVFSGMQTGRDVCIRLALYDKDDSILISPAYNTFIVKDKLELLPEYLFIQFNRFQMDRYGWFLSDGSVRSNLDWDVFCNIQIPLPDIDTQQELVDTYNGLKALAEQNEALIEPLIKACQAYIVDCKKKYPEVELGEYIEESKLKNSANQYGLNELHGITSDGVFDDSRANTTGLSFHNYKIVFLSEFAYNPSRINLGSIARNTKSLSIISPMYIVFKIVSDLLLPEFLQIYFSRKEFQRSTLFYAMGSVRDTFDFNLMQEVKIPLPPTEIQEAIVNIYDCAEEAKKIANEAREKMKILCPALVQKAING